MDDDLSDQSEILSIYLKAMRIIKFRIDSIRLVLQRKDYKTPFEATNIEFCVLQIRKTLELIALGSLVANSDLYKKHYDDLQKMWNGRLIVRDMEKVNPNFYPIAIEIDTSKNPHAFMTKNEGFLSREEFVSLYDKCAKLLHSESLYMSDKDTENMYKYYRENIPKWCVSIMNLLNPHIIELADGKSMFYVTMETPDLTGPQGNIFTQIE